MPHISFLYVLIAGCVLFCLLKWQISHQIHLGGTPLFFLTFTKIPNNKFCSCSHLFLCRFMYQHFNQLIRPMNLHQTCTHIYATYKLYISKTHFLCVEVSDQKMTLLLNDTFENVWSGVTLNEFVLNYAARLHVLVHQLVIKSSIYDRFNWQFQNKQPDLPSHYMLILSEGIKSLKSEWGVNSAHPSANSTWKWRDNTLSYVEIDIALFLQWQPKTTHRCLRNQWLCCHISFRHPSAKP